MRLHWADKVSECCWSLANHMAVYDYPWPGEEVLVNRTSPFERRWINSRWKCTRCKQVCEVIGPYIREEIDHGKETGNSIGHA